MSNFDKLLENFDAGVTKEPIPQPTQVVSLSPEQQTSAVFGSDCCKTEVITYLASSAKGEYEAIEGYTRFLGLLRNLPDSQLKNQLIEKVEEVVSDELEHSKSFQSLYTLVSGIQEAED